MGAVVVMCGASGQVGDLHYVRDLRPSCLGVPHGRSGDPRRAPGVHRSRHQDEPRAPEPGAYDSARPGSPSAEGASRSHVSGPSCRARGRAERRVAGRVRSRRRPSSLRVIGHLTAVPLQAERRERPMTVAATTASTAHGRIPARSRAANGRQPARAATTRARTLQLTVDAVLRDTTLLVLAGWTVIAGSLATRAYRRDESCRSR